MKKIITDLEWNSRAVASLSDRRFCPLNEKHKQVIIILEAVRFEDLNCQATSSASDLKPNTTRGEGIPSPAFHLSRGMYMYYERCTCRIIGEIK